MLGTRTAAVIALALGAAGLLAGVFLLDGGASAAVPRPPSAQPDRAAPAAMAPLVVAPLNVPILMYHYVDHTPPDTGPAAAGLTVSPQEFGAQMDYLAAEGYHPVTIAQVYAAMAGGARLPSRPVAITFDDGGSDNYGVAFPILREHGFTATFFVITGYVGGRACMTWDQLREMQAAGMDIESHTVSHPDLRTLGAAGLAEELGRSREALGHGVGSRCAVPLVSPGAVRQDGDRRRPGGRLSRRGHYAASGPAAEPHLHVRLAAHARVAGAEPRRVRTDPGGAPAGECPVGGMRLGCGRRRGRPSPGSRSRRAPPRPQRAPAAQRRATCYTPASQPARDSWYRIRGRSDRQSRPASRGRV